MNFLFCDRDQTGGLIKEKHVKGRVQIRSSRVLLVPAQFEACVLLLSGENNLKMTEWPLLLIVSWQFCVFLHLLPLVLILKALL